MADHTPTPWAYRPKEHDDWGWIRDADGNLAAVARDSRVWSEHFDRYRAAKTDPYEPNAAFIIKAVNNHDALVSALEDARTFMIEMRARHGDSGVGILIRAADVALDACLPSANDVRGILRDVGGSGK